MGRQKAAEAGRKHRRAAHGLFGYKWYHRGRGWDSATREEKEGKTHVLMDPIPWSPFPNVHTCLRMSHWVLWQFRYSDFFKKLFLSVWKLKLWNFISFASLSTTPRACWSRRNRRRSSRWDSSPCRSCPGHSVSPCIPGLPGSSSAFLFVGIWGSRCSELDVSIGFT